MLKVESTPLFLLPEPKRQTQSKYHRCRKLEIRGRMKDFLADAVDP